MLIHSWEKGGKKIAHYLHVTPPVLYKHRACLNKFLTNEVKDVNFTGSDITTTPPRLPRTGNTVRSLSRITIASVCICVWETNRRLLWWGFFFLLTTFTESPFKGVWPNSVLSCSLDSVPRCVTQDNECWEWLESFDQMPCLSGALCKGVLCLMTLRMI